MLTLAACIKIVMPHGGARVAISRLGGFMDGQSISMPFIGIKTLKNRPGVLQNPIIHATFALAFENKAGPIAQLVRAPDS